MTAIDPATVWAPVPTRWRHVRAGDITVGADGDLIPIISTIYRSTSVRVEYLAGAMNEATECDPDEMVDVLVSLPERDALRLTAEQLGGWVIDRETDGRGVA